MHREYPLKGSPSSSLIHGLSTFQTLEVPACRLYPIFGTAGGPRTCPFAKNTDLQQKRKRNNTKKPSQQKQQFRGISAPLPASMVTLVARQLGSRRHGVSRIQRPALGTMWSTERSSATGSPHPTTAARLGSRPTEVAPYTCGYPVGNDGGT